MELHQLRCFVAAAEELHFGRAATRLHMTQPPLSRQIQLLERSLGIVLLERNNRGVRLTAAGRGFLRDARHILTFSEQAGNSARRLASGEVGRLTLGFTGVSAYSMVPQLLAKAAVEMPEVKFVLKEMVSDAQLDALSANLIDIGLVRQVRDREMFDAQLVYREPLLVVLPSEHPLTTQPSIALADINHQPFVMYAADEGRYFYDCIVGLFAMSGVTPRYAYHLGQTHAIVSMVQAGLGLSIVPASARQLHSGAVVFRPLRDATLNADLHMISRRDNENPVLPAFRDLLSREFEHNRG
ncbi:LysR family transcriptional regulator [Pseudomonas quasicaspiana]|uniref:LysR family transcriptional regulator n=1 Tax=Pseudomonas quasicaspiana TaxID=2829821 RepID=UPI001E3EB17F|nr:LysR family transcriptional regulator [Pseudomonas quasicaspiana]MCD5974785.1 LysR family transcriptional regulator [Pseudomonas quasicaspiana]